jgi:predicted cytidylate kinase
MKFKNIAISGDIGTGKSTLAKMLSQKLGFKYISTGEFFRKWYQDHNLNISEVDQIPEELDRKIDSEYQNLMKVGEAAIFESRLAGYLAKDIPTIYKVLCVTDPEEAIRRVAQREHTTFAQAKEQSDKRSQDLIKKFERLYGVGDFLSPKYFDLMINTTNKPPEQVLTEVLEQMEK